MTLLRIAAATALLGLALAACTAGFAPTLVPSRTPTPTFPSTVSHPPGCKVISPAQPWACAYDTRPPASTPTPTPTPSQTPSPTPTPEGFLPVGLIYESGGSLWRASPAGTPVVFLPGTESSSFLLSQDRKHALVVENQPDHFIPSAESLLDLASGHRIGVWPLAEGPSCPLTFAKQNLRYLATTLLPDGRDPGYDCDPGSPALLPIAGGPLLVLDPDRSAEGLWAISPDGRQVAFDKAGQPWIYSFGDGSKPLSLTDYGFPEGEGDHFFSPSWSPDGNLLAWDFISEADDRQGVVIFDLRAGTYSTIEPLEVGRWEVCQGDIRWSQDMSYVSVSHCEFSYAVIATRAGETILRLDQYTTMSWAPSGHAFVSSRFNLKPFSGGILAFATDPNAAPVAIGEARLIQWLNENTVLLLRGDSYYVLDLASWDEDRLALPAGAVVRYYPQ